MEEVQKSAFQGACCFPKIQQVAALNLTFVTLEGLLAAAVLFLEKGRPLTKEFIFSKSSCQSRLQGTVEHIVPLKVNFWMNPERTKTASLGRRTGEKAVESQNEGRELRDTSKQTESDWVGMINFRVSSVGERQHVRTRPLLPLSKTDKKPLTTLPEQGEKPQLWGEKKTQESIIGKKHTALI